MYGWILRNVPQTCNCCTHFTIDHATICHMGGPSDTMRSKILLLPCSLRYVIMLQSNHPFKHSLERAAQPTQIITPAWCKRLLKPFTFFDVRVFYSNANAFSNHSTVISIGDISRLTSVTMDVSVMRSMVFHPWSFPVLEAWEKKLLLSITLADIIVRKRKHTY